MVATTSPPAARVRILLAALPVAAAIGVFGVVYGAAARPLLGPELTVVSSVVVFSGAAQFTMIALLAAGAAPAAVVVGTGVLALRHVPLGAMLRPRISASRRHRALVSWFLIDETTGLALTLDEPVERTLAISGAAAHLAWVVGTIGGVAGASLASAEPVADALFPVLFVGLATLTASTRADGGRALFAGAAALGLLLVWPAAGALGAIVVAVTTAAVVAAP